VLTKQTIRKLAISMHVEKEISLFILLCSDGTIKRIGPGAQAEAGLGMRTGSIPGPVLDTILDNIPEDLLSRSGCYETKQKKGQCCEVEIIFTNQAEDEVVGFQFIYGSESSGIPREIKELIMSAVQATDHWYTRQKTL
jgi:hypothetical protein